MAVSGLAYPPQAVLRLSSLLEEHVGTRLSGDPAAIGFESGDCATECRFSDELSATREVWWSNAGVLLLDGGLTIPLSGLSITVGYGLR